METSITVSVPTTEVGISILRSVASTLEQRLTSSATLNKPVKTALGRGYDSLIDNGPVEVKEVPEVLKEKPKAKIETTPKTTKTETAEKPKRKRRTKAEIEAAKAKEAAKENEDDAQDDAEVSDEIDISEMKKEIKSEYTGMGEDEEIEPDDFDLTGEVIDIKSNSVDLEKDLIPKFQSLVQADPKAGRAKAVKILTDYGVKSVRDIPKEKYSEVYAML